ncbi:hypothetical protein KAR91_57070 [Candidatus Pacearchaeota archaeon]|nr:hypothetical protein [Candidatus Pacearchaeota archaeon]
MNKKIEACPIGPFRMMKCNEDEVRELEAKYAELETIINDLKNISPNHVSYLEALSQKETENEKLTEQVKSYKNALTEIWNDFDCDSDAHKYNTTCRCCLAKKTIKGDQDEG